VKGAFVDTAHWLALLVSNDEHHGRAEAWSERVLPPLVTTQMVLFEVADALTAPPVRGMAGDFLAKILHDDSIQIVKIDDSLFGAALDLFCGRPDKAWGLTDCLSFVVMERWKLTAALTSDHHFVQAGYRALLLEEPNAADA